MGGLRKLRRRSRSAHYKVEPLRPKGPFHLRKMSEVIIDFAEPLLNAIDDCDHELFEYVISFAIICWNASLLPQKKQKKVLFSMVDKLAESDVLFRLSVEDDVRVLLERKKAFFADDKRMVVDYKIVEENGLYHLFAMSTMAYDGVDDTR